MADLNAASAVVRVLLVTFAMAAGLHAAPDLVLGRVSGAVGSQRGDGPFEFQTAAGLTQSACQAVDANRPFSATLASTEGVRSPLSIRRRQHPENGPAPVLHGLNYIPGFTFNVEAGILEKVPAAPEKQP